MSLCEVSIQHLIPWISDSLLKNSIMLKFSRMKRIVPIDNVKLHFRNRLKPIALSQPKFYTMSLHVKLSIFNCLLTQVRSINLTILDSQSNFNRSYTTSSTNLQHFLTRLRMLEHLRSQKSSTQKDSWGKNCWKNNILSALLSILKSPFVSLSILTLYDFTVCSGLQIHPSQLYNNND